MALVDTCPLNFLPVEIRFQISSYIFGGTLSCLVERYVGREGVTWTPLHGALRRNPRYIQNPYERSVRDFQNVWSNAWLDDVDNVFLQGMCTHCFCQRLESLEGILRSSGQP